jgi:hypothetical protein
MADWRDTDWANLIPGEKRYDEEQKQYYDNGGNNSIPVAEPTQQVDYQQPQAVEPVDQEAFWGSEERVSGNYWTPSRIMSLDNQANWITDDATSGAGHYENSDLITANVDHKQIHDTAQYLNAATQGQYSWDDDYWKNHNWRTDNETWNNYVKNWEVPADYVAQTETNAVQAEQVQSPTTTPQANNQVADTGVVAPQTTTTTQTATGTDINAGTYHINGGNVNYGSMDELVSAMDTDYRNSGLANDKQTTMLNVDKTGADYNNLDTYGKITYGLSSGQTGSVENAPEAMEYTKGMKQALMSSRGPGQATEDVVSMFAGNTAGKIAGGAMTAVLGVVTYGANKGWWEMPEFLGKGLELFDLGDTLGSQAYGKFALAFKEVTGDDLSDPNYLFKNINSILNHWSEITGAYGKVGDYDSDLVDMLMKYSADTMTAIGGGAISRLDQNVTSTLLGSDYYLEKGQVTRAVLGLDGVYTLEDGTYGEEGLRQWLDIAQNLRNMGYNDAQIEAYISHKMYEYYGDYSELAQTNEHEAMDISNYTNGVYARALQGVGKVTGDVNLQNAAKANTGDLYSDVLHNFLPSNMQRVVQQALTTVSKGTIHESGGVNDIKDIYDMENVYGDLDKVTKFGKRFSGIQEDGTLKGTFTPNQNETVSQRMKSFFSETNESKMYSEADTIINVLNTALDDALRARGNEDPASTAQRFEQLVTELTDPDAIGENSPLAGIKNTAIYQTIKSDIASGIGKNADTLRGYVAQFKNTANNRTMLNNVAEALGMSAAEVITQFNEKPDTIKKTIADAVTKNGGTLGKIAMPDVLTADDFANKVQQTLQPFVGKDGIAWDARLLGMQMSTKMFDGIQDTLMGKYEVKSKNALYRFGDTIRALQSLILLGLSPTYVANNLTNNIATRYTLGYGGFLTQKVIDDWNDRWGFKSARAEVSEGEYGDMSKDGDSLRGRLHAKVKDKTTVKDWMNKVKTEAEGWNKNIGVFSKLSNVIENKESEQIMNMACRTYMARTWKEGVNYRKMDPYLENMMGEDMTKAVYAAINSSVNQAEIEDAIFGTYMKPSIHEAIADAARQAGIDNPEEYVNEVFVKTGLEEKLRSGLSGLQGEKEIKEAIEKVKDYSRNFAEYKYRSDMASKAEAVENVVTGEGVSAVIDQMIRMQNEYYRLTENWKQRMSLLYSMKVQMTDADWSAEYTKARKENDARFKQIYDMNTQVLLGVLNGLGITDDGRKKYKSILIDAMQIKQDAYLRMYDRQVEAFEIYRDAITIAGEAKRNGGNKKAWEASVRKAWREYNATMDGINQDVVNTETKQNKRFSDALFGGLKTVTDKSQYADIEKRVINPLNQANEIRKQINEIESQLRKDSRKVEDYTARNEIYNQQKANLQQLRAQENKLRMEAYKAIKDITQKAPDISVEETIAYDQEDYDIAARLEVLKREAEQKQRENSEYVAQVEEDLKVDGEFAFGDNDMFTADLEVRVNGRKLLGLARDAGATMKQAKEYTKFMMTVKKAYEYNHPQEDFWAKLNLRVDFVNENGAKNEQGEVLKGMFNYKAGENIVTIFKNGDLSTLIHESMHAITSILDDQQKADLATWYSISAEHLNELQSKFMNGEKLTAEESAEWNDLQEKFAYGFEEYIRNESAVSEGIRGVFRAVRMFLCDLYENLKEFIGGVDPNEERNGIRLADIFESLVRFDKEKRRQEKERQTPREVTITNEGIAFQQEQAQANGVTDNNVGNNEPLNQFDYTNRDAYKVKPNEIDPAKVQPFQHDEARVALYAQKMYETASNKDSQLKYVGLDGFKSFVRGEDIAYNTELGGALRGLAMDAGVIDRIMSYWFEVNGFNKAETEGYSLRSCVEYEYAGQTIKAKIYHNGELVALIPNELPVTEVTIDDDVKCKVVGIDPNNPEAVVIATPNETLITIDPSAGRENKMKSEAFRPEMDVDSMPTIDPEGEATAEINFEQIIPILERLSGIYAGKIDSAMTSNKYGNLTPEGQRLLREYIDYVVRQDLASTKFKATKFSEMMRDAALLNYDKRYGFDNFLTFLSPYQFWQTRSAANWLRRLNDRKHLFNRYFRLKEMATKREKDFLPSRVEGMYGLPIYGLPDWMGSRVFFNTQQEVPIAGFLDPILESAEESSVLEASAKEILGQWVDAGTITSEQYTIAVNDHNNEKWKEAMAQAEIENPRTHDTASVLQDYLGLSLPASWIKAGIENDPSALSQLPSTKLGNALGATFTSSRTDSLGKLINGVGDTAQFVASLPERGMHAVMKGAFGDEFEYKDFGSYGDYYIDQQLFYMVMEGLITTDQMLLAMEQRDGNEVYEKAYDRAREQIAMKTPGYASVASLKNLYADGKKLAQGDESVSWKDLGNDLVGTLESFALSPKGLYIVSEGESKMREGMAEQTKAYENGTQNQFFKDNPEMSYKNLQYMTDDPEGRYRTWCYKNITNIYYSMNDDERKNVCMALGEDFEYAIGVGNGSKETRCYETVDLKKLTGWTQALMGETPYMNNSDYGQEAEKYNYTPLPEQTLNEIQLYKKQKDEMFPNIAMVESNYWNLAPELRDDYVARFPELDNMWAWTEQYKETHPEYDAWTGRKRDYYNQREADKAFKLMSNLTLNAFKRNDVTSDYYGEIRRIQQEIGNTDDIEKFVQELQDYYIG